MKVRYILLLVLLGLIISSVFYFTECKQEKTKVTSYKVELINNEYTMENNTISFSYGGKVDIGAEDFRVTEIYSDGTTKVMSQKSENNGGYEFESTIPVYEITPAGNYTLTFTHIKLNKSIEIKIIVNKTSFDMSEVSWDYTSPFTYDGTEKEVKITNLPVGVSVSYVGNKATNTGIYSATAIFTHNKENFETIPNKTLTWQIVPTEFKVEGTAKLKEEYKNLVYKGSDYVVELDLSGFDANNVRATIDNNSIVGKDVGTYFARVDLEYIGTNVNYNRLDKTFVIVEWEIEKTPLLITAKSHSIVYGDNPSNNGVTYSGFVGNDTEINLGGVLDFDYTYTKGDDAKIGYYTITPKGVSSKNYQITFVSGYLNVEKAKIDFKNVDWIKNISYIYSGEVIKPQLNFVSNEFVCINYIYAKMGGGIAEPINVGKYVAMVEVVVNKNYEIINNHVTDYSFEIITKEIDCSMAIWQGKEEYILGEEIVKPILINLPSEVIAAYEYYLGDAIVEEFASAGSYKSVVSINPINSNYVISKYPMMEFNFVVSEPEIENPEEQNDYNIKLVVGDVEYGIYKDGSLNNLEYDPNRSVYFGTVALDYFFEDEFKLIFDSIYVFEGFVVEDLCASSQREIELIDGYAENVWLTILSGYDSGPYVSLYIMEYNVTIILYCGN